jgi:hypothetical protein
MTIHTPDSRPDTAPEQNDHAADATTSNKSVARWLTPALVLVATLGLGVLGGVLIGQNTGDDARASGGPGFGGSDSSASAPGDRMAGDLTTGTVVSVDGDVVTLTTSDGSTVSVTATDDTTVSTTEDATVGELAEGDTLAVVGEADEDGDVEATSIAEGETGFAGGMGADRPTDGE